MERELVAKYNISLEDAIQALNDAKYILDGKMSTLWGKPELMMMASQLLGHTPSQDQDDIDDDWNNNHRNNDMDGTMGETTTSWDPMGEEEHQPQNHHQHHQQQHVLNAISHDEEHANHNNIINETIEVLAVEETKTVTLQMIMNGKHDVHLNQKRHALPEELKRAGVPLARWQSVYDSIDTGLSPAVTKLNNFLLESSKKEQPQIQSLKMNVMTNNVTLLACNIVQKANFLFNPYGILVQQITQQQPIPGDKETTTAIQLDQPIGLRFVIFANNASNGNMLSGGASVPHEILLYPCH